MTNPFKNEAKSPRMEAGSYWHVPTNSVHATACVSDTPCEFYFHAGKGFDFKQVE
jgi:quercetin dioxygenase-like cupin family protein